MAAAAVSLACPLRRSTRLAHAHSHTHHPATHSRQAHKLKPHHQRHHPRPPPDPEPDQDSSSSDPENELTPRALRALKRQRLALDVDGLPFPPRSRPRKRRKENIVRTDVDDSKPSQLPCKDIECLKRPSSPTLSPLVSQSIHTPGSTATSDAAAQPSTPSPPIPEQNGGPPADATLLISISSPQPDTKQPVSPTLHELSLTVTCSPKANDPQELSAPIINKPELSIPLSPISTTSPPVPAITPRDASTSPEPLTPLTPLTPSPESSPSLPSHDQQGSVPPSPPHDLLPPLVSLENLPSQHSSDSTQRTSAVLQQVPTESLPSQSLSSPSPPITLNPVLDTLIPFEGLSPQFEPELGVQIPSSPSSQPPQPPQLPGLDFPEQFPSFTQQPVYVPPYPDPRREINIWKLACRERVDYILKCTRKSIKELLAPEAHLNSQGIHRTRSPSNPTSLDPQSTQLDATLTNTPSQTKFRLYTPASYTYSSTSWGSNSGARNPLSMDEDMEDGDVAWPMDDSDWVDGDVDMEDEDEDDYEDDDDLGAGDAEGEGEGTLGAVEGLAIGESSTLGTSTTSALDPPFEVDESQTMQVDVGERSSSSERPTAKAATVSDPPISPRLSIPIVTALDPPPRPATPPLHPSPSPPLALERLPSLSSLHVPILSEPSRSFMGRGTPPDRRRLIEWSGAGRFATNGMGPPLYLSPVPQRHASTDVGIVPMSVDGPIHPTTPHPQPTHGEWTSFLYSMLEGDGVGVGTGVTEASHASESAWYELGLGSVPAAVPPTDLGVPLSHPHSRTPAVEQVVDDGSSSSTLRFALG